MFINIFRSHRFICIKIIAIIIYSIKNFKCFIKSIISFEHCFFRIFRLIFLPRLVTPISSVTFLLFFISSNIASNILATLLLWLIYFFALSTSFLLLSVTFFGPLKIHIDLLQHQRAFSTHYLMMNIQIFWL